MLNKARGKDGAIRWGYRPVASLTSWAFEGTPQHGTITAQIIEPDEFGLDQQPLVVTVPVGQSQWRWPVTGLLRDGLSVTVTVGALE